MRVVTVCGVLLLLSFSLLLLLLSLHVSPSLLRCPPSLSPALSLSPTVLFIIDDAFVFPLLHSLSSLRSHYTGAVAVLSSPPLSYSPSSLRPLLLDVCRRYNVSLFFRPVPPPLPRYLARLGSSLFSHAPPAAQFHKLWAFDPSLAFGGRVLYLDAGVTVNGPLDALLALPIRPGHVVAHSDRYPGTNPGWSLRGQLLGSEEAALKARGVNVDADYFQTTMMMFDPSSLGPSVLSDVFALFEWDGFVYRLNEQSLLNVYFRHRWTPLHTLPGYCAPVCYYDFLVRDPRKCYAVFKYRDERHFWARRTFGDAALG